MCILPRQHTRRCFSCCNICHIYLIRLLTYSLLCCQSRGSDRRWRWRGAEWTQRSRDAVDTDDGSWLVDNDLYTISDQPSPPSGQTALPQRSQRHPRRHRRRQVCITFIIPYLTRCVFSSLMRPMHIPWALLLLVSDCLFVRQTWLLWQLAVEARDFFEGGGWLQSQLSPHRCRVVDANSYTNVVSIGLTQAVPRWWESEDKTHNIIISFHHIVSV